jgi:hypothetical protein
MERYRVRDGKQVRQHLRGVARRLAPILFDAVIPVVAVNLLLESVRNILLAV